MDRRSLGKQSPAAQTIPNTDIRISEDKSGYRFTIPGDSMQLELALGSGKTGMTYVAYFDENTLFELHWSYFPSERRWYVTPGHERNPPTDAGVLYERRRAVQCLLCHAVTLPQATLRPEPKFFGVGCESCHGPASLHVDAARAGRIKDLSIERLGKWPARRLHEMCGRCHRTAQAISQQSQQAGKTVRFQPYSLMLSRCFKETGEKLSCLSCHDPHRNASTNLKTYETACLRCHSGNAAPVVSKTAPGASVNGKTCPVSADFYGGAPHCGLSGRQEVSTLTSTIVAS
jgi:predicted CXXCH cytochrome family protein